MAWVIPFGATAVMLDMALSPIRPTGIEYRFFDNLASARAWIENGDGQRAP